MAGNRWSTDRIEDQSGRVVVITGATSGIGKEAARVLAQKNASVVIGARNLAKAEAVADEIRKETPAASVLIKELDLTSLESVKAFAGSLLRDFDRLDVLINNAGIMACPHSTTKDGFEIQMGTNHLGHFALTGHLMPLLRQTSDSRIVVLSSIAHKFGDISLTDLNWEARPYNTNKAYSDSKLANLYFLRELERRLHNDPDAPLVAAAHPGWTSTELQRHVGFLGFFNYFFAQGVEQGALPTLRAGFDKEVRPGHFYGPSRFFELNGAPVQVKASKRAENSELARQLWAKSEELTGVSY